MKLGSYEKMDPHLLVGLVNTEMRNGDFDIIELVKRHDLNEDSLRKKLADAGYSYHEDLKQFSPCRRS